MNFCSECGSAKLDFKVPQGDHLPRFVCADCGLIHYENPRMIVGCIPLWKDRVLIARRAIEPRYGLWNLPCGFLESGETVEEGAKREVLEETGAEVDLIRLHTVYNLPHARQVYLIFLAEMRSENCSTTLESSEVQLFTEEEMPWLEMAFTSSTFALRSYFSDRKTTNKTVHIGTHRPE